MNNVNIENTVYKIVDTYNNSYIECLIEVNRIKVKLIISFPKGFPYQFPEIIVKGEEYKKLPHIDKKSGKICLFKEEARPNPTKPREVIIESINQAIKVIQNGLNGVNREDFIDEFEAYWVEDDDIIGNMDVFFEPLNKVERLKCIYSKDYSFWCCGINYEELIKYARRGYKESDLITNDAIYIPLSQKIFPPFPSNNKEFYKIIENEEYGNEYKKFLTNRKGIAIILFSQKDKEDYILSCIIHTGIKDIKGFRTGKIIPDIAYKVYFAKNKTFKLTTEIVNRKRLFYRGGDGNMIDKKVSILGCGSLGGYIVQAISEMGVNDFKLMDEQILRKENIARHICGIDFVDMYKTEAIRKKMESHYVDLKIETYNNNIYKILNDNIEELEDRDIQFIAVGDKSLESFIIKKFNDGEIKRKLIIVWVEPYVIGGHAIVLNKRQSNIESCIYDENWELKNRILEKPENFTQKEAGCQNYFIQYSGFEADFFIKTVLDNIFNGDLFDNRNYLISYAGRIDWARKNQFELMPKWISSKNRTVKIEEL